VPNQQPSIVGQRFPKARRVRRRGEFQQVFDKGTRVHGRYFTVLMAPSDAAQPRLGIVASRKLGGAVARNRAKRLIREVFRRNPVPGRQGVDVVVIPRRELFDASYASLQTDFLAVCRRGAARLADHARQ
jgi:ribonuclease P protein component